MKRLFPLAIVLMSMMPAPPVTTSETVKSGTIVSSLFVPFDESIFVATTGVGDYVQFTGQFHIVLHFIPGNPVRFFSNAVAIKGTGSQGSYNLTGNGVTDQLEINGSELRVRQIFRLIPGNPVVPGNPVHILFTLQLNPIGEVTKATAQVVIEEG